VSLTVIYKYQLMAPVVELNVPDGGVVRLVDRDPGSINPTLWIEHDLTKPLVPRTFLVVGTGMYVEPDATHVGSMVAGEFVWHIYERP
jgi:hypothetical protein